MAYKLDGNGQIDPTHISDRVLDERESRKRIMARCRQLGCERDMLALFMKWDQKMKNCRNDAERKDMSKIGNLEIFMLLKSAEHKGGASDGAALYVDGQLVYSDSDHKLDLSGEDKEIK